MPVNKSNFWNMYIRVTFCKKQKAQCTSSNVGGNSNRWSLWMHVPSRMMMMEVRMYVRVAKNRRSTRSCCTHDIHYAKHSNPCRSEGGRRTSVEARSAALSPSRDHMGAGFFFCSQLRCPLLVLLRLAQDAGPSRACWCEPRRASPSHCSWARRRRSIRLDTK